MFPGITVTLGMFVEIMRSRDYVLQIPNVPLKQIASQQFQTLFAIPPGSVGNIT